jgi:hypothetical protein
MTCNCTVAYLFSTFHNLTFCFADHGCRGSRLHRAMYPSSASLDTSAVTRIETFLFTKLNLSQAALFLANVRYGNQSVSIEVISFPDQKRRIEAVFPHAVIETFEFDENERIEWPLDIIGFDCSAVGERWSFVLHYTEAEWSWHSEWPSVRSFR